MFHVSWRASVGSQNSLNNVIEYIGIYLFMNNQINFILIWNKNKKFRKTENLKSKQKKSGRNYRLNL